MFLPRLASASADLLMELIIHRFRGSAGDDAGEQD
jgi:hypothetical protein